MRLTLKDGQFLAVMGKLDDSMTRTKYKAQGVLANLRGAFGRYPVSVGSPKLRFE
jgi:hypothetical protein